MSVTVIYQPPAINPIAALTGAKQAAELAGANALLAASQPLVPVDKGELVASGHVEHDGHGAAVIYSALSKDGYDYAAIQHERMDYAHEHGQAKYLEQPAETEGPAILAGIVGVLGKVL